MINILSRSLNEDEIDVLDKQIVASEVVINRIVKMWPVLPIVLLIGIRIAVSVGRHHNNIYFGLAAFAVAVIFCLIFLWANHDVLKEERMRLNHCQKALRENIAEVIRCQSQNVVKIMDIGISESGYCFQVDNDKIFCIRIKETDLIRRFPNSSFEVNTIYGLNKDMPVFFNIRCEGERLRPMRVVSTKQFNIKNFPKHREIIEGCLENVETILRDRKTKLKI